MKLEEFLAATEDGHIFGVTFIKRSTGEERKMQCRRGAHVGLKGVGMSFKPEEKKLLTVYDMNKVDEKRSPGKKGAYRAIPLDGLMEVRLKGQVFRWDEESQEFLPV